MAGRGRGRLQPSSTPAQGFVYGWKYTGPPVSCTKVLNCGHPCLESKFDPDKPCRSCVEYMEFNLPCGHKAFGYCGIGIPESHKCRGVCGKRRRCGHQCLEGCGVHATDECDDPAASSLDACKYCVVYREAKLGNRPMPEYFLKLDNGIQADDPLGPRFMENCVGMTPEQVAEYRLRLQRQGIVKASDFLRRYH